MKGIFVIATLTIAALYFLIEGRIVNSNLQSRGSDEQELREKLREWDEAYARRDTKALGRILADGFTFTNPNGVVIDRTRYISANLKAPDMTLEMPIESDEVHVRVYGGAAVVISRGALRGQPLNRDPTVRYRYTDVWVKREALWQVVASQATRITQ